MCNHKSSRKTGNTYMWSTLYDRLLYALAFLEFKRRSVPVNGFHSTERYGSYADCNGTRYLSTRVLPMWMVPQSMLEARSMFYFALRARGEKEAVVHQVGKHRMAHNLALACKEGVLYAYGGPDTRNQFSEWMGAHDGVYRARVMPDGSLQGPERMFGGRHEGCVEKRLSFGGVCEFDGKFSVVEFGGRTHLFARANTVWRHGGRHVQVTSSVDGRTNWAPFEMLSIEGVRTEPENNIYFFVADTWNTTHMIGTYPAVFSDDHGGVRSGVFASYSTDGKRWSAPDPVVESDSFGQRVELFPVGVREGAVHVMHVNLLNQDSGSAHDVYIWKYPLGHGLSARVRDFDVDLLQLIN
jgi:hypothetical protein